MLRCYRTLILGFMLLASVGCYRNAPPEPILIGHLAPFSGPDKLVGEHAKQGILLAVEEVNKPDNRILGRRIAVVHPNYSQEASAKLEPVATRLLAVDHVVALLGGMDQRQVQSLGHVAQANEAALVTPAELPSQIVNGNVYSVSVGLVREGRALARFAAKQLSINQSLVVLVDRSEPTKSTAGGPSTVSISDAFTREFSRLVPVPIQTIAYEGTADLPKKFDLVKRAKPQAILYTGRLLDLAAFRAKLSEAGLKPVLLAGGDGEHLGQFLADREASQGVYIATPFVAAEGTPQSLDFVKRYQERFHESPDVHAALAYDGVRVLAEAMRRAKSFQPKLIVDELGKSESQPFEALFGPGTFDKNHSARRPLYAGQIEDGQVRKPKIYPADEE